MRLARLTVGAFFVIGFALACAPIDSTAATIKVEPGESIQAAVDLAAPGDKVLVMPGTYIETHGGFSGVRINKSLKLIGKKKGTNKVILQAGVGQDDGILVEPDVPPTPIDGLRIKGITVEGFPGNGIHLRYVNDFRIDKNESINNLENGIFPTLSANGTVKQNLSYGSQDSALWVESSENVRVLDNVLHSSPTGLEVTVSNNLEIKGNEVYNNTVGMGLYHPNAASLPPLAGEMVNWEIRDNYVHDNNAPNVAPPGSMSSNLPPGGGILILGTDGAMVHDNIVENNDFYGLAIVDWCLATNGTPFNCTDIPPITNQYPELNCVQGNTFTNNGTNPTAHPLAPYAADITYVALDHYGNQFAQNTYSTSEVALIGPIWLLGNGTCL